MSTKKIVLFTLVLSIWAAVGTFGYWLWETGNILLFVTFALLVVARVCFVNLES